MNNLVLALVEEWKLPFSGEYLSWKLGWQRDFSDGIIREYKRFLVLALTAREEVTPSKEIDEVWHYHILHTREYARFAQDVGAFLHHHPGGPSTEDAHKFNGQYERTKRLYEETFGEAPPSAFWPGTTAPRLKDVVSRLME